MPALRLSPVIALCTAIKSALKHQNKSIASTAVEFSSSVGMQFIHLKFCYGLLTCTESVPLKLVNEWLNGNHCYCACKRKRRSSKYGKHGILPRSRVASCISLSKILCRFKTKPCICRALFWNILESADSTWMLIPESTDMRCLPPPTGATLPWKGLPALKSWKMSDHSLCWIQSEP